MNENEYGNDVLGARCPLCFTALDRDRRLIRFCPSDHEKNWRMFECTPENLRAEIYCWRDECRLKKKTIQSNVFFLHVGCEAVNPFWQPGQQKVVVEANVRLQDPSGVRAPALVTHWEVGTLREAARVPELAVRPEMWFPQALLRATFERGAHGLRAGSCVKVSGATSVGKTLLATMALSRRNLNGAKYLGHYVYLPRKDDASQPEGDFLEGIYPLQLLAAANPNPKDWIPPSNPKRLNLKALFLSEENSGDTGRNGRKPGSRSVVSSVFRILRDQIGNAVTSADTLSRAASSAYALSFYDTAGEEAIRHDLDRARRIEEFMDVVAVVMNVTDLVHLRQFAKQDPDREYVYSVPGAIERLSEVANTRASVCLILTKLDQIEDETVKKEMTRIAAGKDSGTMRERELVCDWLAKGVAAGYTAEGILEQQLLDMVADAEKVHRVFFLWTENLFDPKLLPVTKGLMKFVSWCREGASKEIVSEPTRSAVAGS